jgi:tetratricopeptide (TPR) repeat protein
MPKGRHAHGHVGGAARSRTVLRLHRRLNPCLSIACQALLWLGGLLAQSPAPGAAAPPATAWLRHGSGLLDSEDPLGAWDAFRRARATGGDELGCHVGLGRAHLMLGRSTFAIAYAEAALAISGASQDAMALCVRALIRGRAFEDAVRRAGVFVRRANEPNGELLAAQGSALFRVQRIDEAAAAYRRVGALEPTNAEAHLRLGSGLLPPTEVTIPRELELAVADLLADRRERGIERLHAVLATSPQHPIAHRLLGEALFAQRTAASMAAGDPAFAALAAALPVPDVRRLPIGQFVPGYQQLSPARKLVVDRTAAMFGERFEKLIAVGARHDLLRELERTTDADERANLRGRRTFDGRVWDDVRGVGGVQAATGIEALDDAATFGFDTLAHEVAHQVHFLCFTPLQRARLRSLYQAALANGRCLDFYAASNEAEYFGQGVEAFASYGKRPGGETTHGHTRFELRHVDPDLHDFIAGLVDHDPLRAPGVRERVLEASVAVALRCGRPQDAEVAARMLPAGPLQQRLLADAERALAATRVH